MLSRRLPVGERVTATIFFEQKTLTLAARVTHVQPGGVGVTFAEPSLEAMRFVGDISEKLLSDGRAPDDRRRDARQPVSAAIIFTEQGESRPGYIRDLSPTGAYVVTIEPPPIGQSTLVYLPGYSFSEGQPTPSELRGCTAAVIRHGHDDFGCRFVSPSAERLGQISNRFCSGIVSGSSPLHCQARPR